MSKDDQTERGELVAGREHWAIEQVKRAIIGAMVDYGKGAGMAVSSRKAADSIIALLCPATLPADGGVIQADREWRPYIGEEVRVAEHIAEKWPEWRGIPLWVVGVQKDRAGGQYPVAGLNIAVSDEWPVTSRTSGYTDGFFIQRSGDVDDLEPVHRLQSNSAIAGLVEALEKVATGDEPRPIGKSYFPDARISKHDQCTHGIWMYETCGNCIAEFASTALARYRGGVTGMGDAAIGGEGKIGL